MALLNFMRARPADDPDDDDRPVTPSTSPDQAAVASRTPPQSSILTNLVNPTQHDSNGARTIAAPATYPTKESPDHMEHNENLPPAYPFAAADMDIDMIDRAHTPANNGTSVASQAADGNPVEMARQVAVAMQDMVRRVHELETMRTQFEARLTNYDDSLRAYETLKQTLRETTSIPVSEEDMQTLQRVLQALTQDPNHIMVLASVAQQATKLVAVVDAFTKLQGALKQAPPR